MITPHTEGQQEKELLSAARSGCRGWLYRRLVALEITNLEEEIIKLERGEARVEQQEKEILSAARSYKLGEWITSTEYLEELTNLEEELINLEERA